MIIFAVAKLAPNSGLLGGDDKEAALVDQWIHLTDTEILGNQEVIAALLGGSVPYNKPVSPIIVLLCLTMFKGGICSYTPSSVSG